MYGRGAERAHLADVTVVAKLGIGSRAELIRLDLGGNGEGGRAEGSDAPTHRS